MRKVVMEREYVSVDALSAALEDLMKRNYVQNWHRIVFNAGDIDQLINGLTEADYITVTVSVDETALAEADKAEASEG